MVCIYCISCLVPNRKPVVCGISTLDFDHTSLLGTTIESIAWHKAGIMKTNVPTFTVDQQLTPALVTLSDRAKEKEVGCMGIMIITTLWWYIILYGHTSCYCCHQRLVLLGWMKGIRHPDPWLRHKKLLYYNCLNAILLPTVSFVCGSTPGELWVGDQAVAAGNGRQCSVCQCLSCTPVSTILDQLPHNR